MVLKGVVSGSTIDFGADNDTFTLSVAATSTTILGGSGADTLVFTTGADLVTSPSLVVLTVTHCSQLLLRAPLLSQVVEATTPWSSTAAFPVPCQS